MTDIERSFIASFEHIGGIIHKVNVEKGFWPPVTTERNVGEAIALMHSELSEALEYHRDGNPPDDKIPDFSGLEAEFADVLIRIMDFAQGFDLDIPGAILAKIEYNKSRPFKHNRNL